MAFQIKISGEGQNSVIQLTDTVINCVAEVYCFGALLNKFARLHNNTELNVIDGFENVEEAKQTITPAFKSAKLSPFVCRINEAKYTYDRNQYRLSKYSMGNNAIHGLVYDQFFSIVETTSTAESVKVVLEFNYNDSSQGYPFKFNCKVAYELTANSTLSITSTITNLDQKDMPVADGWHPYFTVGDSIDDCEFLLRSKEMLEFDEELIPTGKLIPYNDFSALKKFGSTWFDNCFTVDFKQGSPACVLRNPKRGIEVQIHPGQSYPYLQFYTPDHRQSIAIENLSAAPDAFNNGMGLKILLPQQSAVFHTKFVINPL